MKKIVSCTLAVCLTAAIFCFSDVAQAKNNKGHSHKGGKEASSDVTITIKIGDRNREAIKNYIKGNSRKCPPGLAKKNNGCLPPGIAKKYNIGQPLPEGIFAASLPDDLLKLLYPAPVGHRYVQIDRDILLINSATKNVIDAVTALSALGN